MKKRSDELVAAMNEIEGLRQKSNKKTQVELKIAALKTDIANKRIVYKEKTQLLSDIQKNKEAIIKNSKIDASINVITTNINVTEGLKRTAITNVNSIEKDIIRNNESITLKKSYLLKIAEERKIERYWKLYLQMIGKTETEMRKEFEEQAGKSVKSRLVLEAIVEAEKLEASEEEVAEKLKEMAEKYNKDEKELSENEQLKSYLADSMKTEKAIDFIVKNAKIK